LSRETFGKFIISMGGQQRRLTNAPIGEGMAEKQSLLGNSTRQADILRQARPWGYHFGPLALARTAFVSATGLRMVWPEDQAGADDELPADTNVVTLLTSGVRVKMADSSCLSG
jgi:hypothetical protein